MSIWGRSHSTQVREADEDIVPNPTERTADMSTCTTAPAASVAVAEKGRGRSLLTALAVSSPLWATVSLIQAASRESYDLTRHPLSLLSTGSLGWLQITNFLLAGALAVVGAVGLKRTLASTWIPRLVATYGVGYMLCGIFVLDPADGFPAGTPAGVPDAVSWHAGMHLLAGTVAFIALTAVLIVFGRHFARRGERGWALAARAGAVAVIVADVAAMAGVPAAPAWLASGVILAMLVLSAIAARLSRAV
jgi:hypothetical protein